MSETATDGSSAREVDTTAELVLLSELIDGWVASGVITPEQAARMAGESRVVVVPRPVRSRPAGPSLAMEALAYLGGVIMLVGALSIVGLYWEDLTTLVRLLLVGATGALLLGAGLLVPPHLGAAARRLRAVTWAGTVVATAGFLGLLAGDALDWDPAWVRVTAAGGAAVTAAVLWRRSNVLLQQVVFFVAAMVTAAMTTLALTDADPWPGFAAWCVAAVWLLLAWLDMVPSSRWARPLAAAATIVAAMTTFSSDPGMVLGLLTAVAVVGLAVQRHDLAMVAVGALGLLQMLPIVLTEWFPDTVAAPFVLFGVGAVVLALAVWTATRGRGTKQPGGHRSPGM
jgi:hypothetical protein